MSGKITITHEEALKLEQMSQAAIDAVESETEEVYHERHLKDANQWFRHYIIDLAGGIADTGLIESHFKKMLEVYKQQILGGWQPHTAMNTVVMQFEKHKDIPLTKSEIYRLFDLYFKSIGFMPEIWVQGHHITWSRIEL